MLNFKNLNSMKYRKAAFRYRNITELQDDFYAAEMYGDSRLGTIKNFYEIAVTAVASKDFNRLRQYSAVDIISAYRGHKSLIAALKAPNVRIKINSDIFGDNLVRTSDFEVAIGYNFGRRFTTVRDILQTQAVFDRTAQWLMKHRFRDFTPSQLNLEVI